MAGSVNKVILIGHLGKDPEVRSFDSGNRIATFSLATSESWTDRANNEKKERTEWHNIVLQGDGLARVAEQYLRKGSKLYVEGQLRTRKWQDRDGADRWTTEVVVGVRGQLVLLDRPPGTRAPPPGEDSYASQPARGPDAGARPASSFDEDMDDDVPF